MLNIALLSKWHVHAEDYARQAIQNKNINIKVVWDEEVERGRKWAGQLEVPFESEMGKVLSDPEIDAVIVDTPTNLHKEIMIQAANNKKHIFTEKVLAFTVEDCLEILSAVKENQVQLMVSLPRLTENYYLYAQAVIDKGTLGRLTSIRCRAAHNGAVPTGEGSKGWLPEYFYNKQQTGGGALIDLGAHPIYLTNRLAGKAKAVTAKLQETLGYEVDDNAVVIVEYESGALGTLETSFISAGSPFQLQIFGTEGTLLIEDQTVRLKSKQTGEEWIEPDLPEAIPLPMEQWVDAILEAAEPTLTEEDFMRLTLINEAASVSNEQGRRIVLADFLV
ncbi:Gfo/Idh/MocA family protein [Peribacillus sp. SCS-155]|uniref:Gfo/Idh/MocA family protein n=1 Tax=Peribacillus sedimenti TaxID=3115297 RepID=UPI003906D3DF